jgi:hypothetical protein
MDQVSFEFIRVAMIERVKENPIYCSKLHRWLQQVRA